MSVPPAPAALRLRFPFRTEEEFLAGYGSNLGRGGMFVATKALKPEGTPLTFELVLAGGERLLVGEGVVVKSQIDEGGARAGMTVRFTRLDAAGKELVERAVNLRFGPPIAAQPTTPHRPATPVAGTVAGVRAPPSGSSSGTPESSLGSGPRPADSSEAFPRSTSSAAAPSLGARAERSAPPDEVAQSGEMDGTFRPADGSLEAVPRPVDPLKANAHSTLSAFPGGPETLRPLFLPDDAETPAEAPTQARDARVPVEATTPSPTLPEEPIPTRDAPAPGEPTTAPAEISTSASSDAAPSPRQTPREGLATKLAREAAPAPAPTEPTSAPVESSTSASSDAAPSARQGARDRLAAVLARDAAPAPAPVAPSSLFGVVLASSPHFMRWSKEGDDAQQVVSDEQLFHALDGRPETPTRAVCVVPARLGAGAREAALRSLLANHVQPWRLIARTSALAFAYASGKSLARQRVLLLDFDDDALEAALGVITGDDVEVLALESATSGGTNALDALIAEDLSRATGLAVDATLRQEARRVRQALSTSDETTVQLGGATVRISRDKLQRAIDAWLQSVNATLAAVLARARTEASALDARVAAGAVVATDWLRMLLESHVRGAISAHPVSDLARGAAQFAHAIDERARGKRTGQVSELLGSPVLMLARAGALAPVLDPGTRLPAEKTIAVPVSAGAQVAVHLFDQARLETDAWLGGALLESRERGELTLRVRVDENGCVRLEARRPATERQPVELTRSRDFQGDIAVAPELSVPAPTTEASRWGGLKKLFGRKS